MEQNWGKQKWPKLLVCAVSLNIGWGFREVRDGTRSCGSESCMSCMWCAYYIYLRPTGKSSKIGLGSGGVAMKEAEGQAKGEPKRQSADTSVGWKKQKKMGRQLLSGRKPLFGGKDMPAACMLIMLCGGGRGDILHRALGRSSCGLLMGRDSDISWWRLSF